MPIRSIFLVRVWPLVLVPMLMILPTAGAVHGQNAGGAASDPSSPDDTSSANSDEDSDQDKDEDSDECDLADCRPNFQASLAIGSVIDNFAASELQEYLNPGASGDVQTFERLIGGIGFAYRLVGEPTDRQQLWVHGRTVHGVRSADVDCQAHPSLTICQEQLKRPDVDDFTEQFRFVLRNATSLEAMIGFRWEFLPLHAEDGKRSTSGSSARLYLAAQAGFLAVTDDDDDALDDHAIALGAIATNGKFQNSYLQVGYGPSDLFDVGKDRWKIDAMLRRSLTPPGGAVDYIDFFARFTATVDAGDGADSIQSYFGFALDLGGASDLFKGKKTPNTEDEAP